MKKSVMLFALLCLLVATLISAAPDFLFAPIQFDDPDLSAIYTRSRFFGYQSLVDRDTTDGELAYDYSAHMLYDTKAKLYRFFEGGRWLRKGKKLADGDHVLQFISKTGEPYSFKMPYNHPEAWTGFEMGQTKYWWSNQFLEPEVMRVGDTYYMYTQIMIGPPQPIDLPGKTAKTGCDRIMLFTSSDAHHWNRFKKRGVVINLDDPERTYLHHQEMLYVPWDKDRRPFWMYVAAVVNGRGMGYWRIRTADPFTFDWQKRERTSGFSQLGNQLGYLKQAPGGPLFVRITFTYAPKQKRTVPSLQFSRDGLHWNFGAGEPVKLAGSKDNEHNQGCWFLGLSTLDGTGELPYLGHNTWRTLYAATTCSSPVAPDIFHSEMGLGELWLKAIPKKR